MLSRPHPTSQPLRLPTDQYSTHLQRERLRVVVLGPGEAQPEDLEKRRQIASRLVGLGYSKTKLGEDFLSAAEMPLHLALLSSLPHIDLLLVLNTGAAPLVELTSISSDFRARQITRVWSKREYNEGRRSTPGDVLAMFDNLPFSKDEFESCELVASFVETADRFCLNKAQSEGRLAGLGLLPPDRDSQGELSDRSPV